MNYGQLKARIASIAHRSDLTNEIADFIQDTTNRLNVRFAMANPPFVLDADTNLILENFSQLYITGTLQSLYEFLNNGDNALYYMDRFNDECDRANTSMFPTEATDPYWNQPLYIRAEEY